MSDGKYFESLTESVFCALSSNGNYTEVTRDTYLLDPDGEKRQIDVLVRTKIFGFQTTTFVECRDHSRAIDKEAVDALASKSEDLPVDVVVLVSRNGFTKGAISKAARKNIRLCTLDQVEDLADLGLDIQLCIVEILPERTFFKFWNESTQKFNAKISEIRFNGLSLVDFLKLNIETGRLKPTTDGTPIYWKKENGNLEVSDGKGHLLSNVEMAIQCELKFYLGLLSQLKNNFLFENLTDKKRSVVYDGTELRNYQNIFKEIQPSEKISVPSGKILKIHVIVPEIKLAKFTGEQYYKDGTVEPFESGAIEGPNPLSPPTPSELKTPEDEKT